MDFLNVSCGTLSVEDINKKEMRQEKKSCGLFFKCRCEYSHLQNFSGSHESFGFGPIALIVETKS